MTRQPLILLMPDAGLHSVQWYCRETRGTVRSGQCAWQELAGTLPGLVAECGHGAVDCVFVLPASTGLQTVISVPRQQRRYLARSLPYLAEAVTSEPAESLEVVAGQALGGAQLEVLAVNNEFLDAVIYPARGCPGAGQIRVYLETQWFAQAGESRSAVLFAGPDGVSGIIAGHGFAALPQDVVRWITHIGSETREPESVRLYMESGLEPAAAEELVASLEAQWPGRVQSEWLVDDYGEWLLTAIAARRDPPTSLMANRTDELASGRRWRQVGQALAAALVLSVTAGTLWLVADVHRLETSVTQYEHALESLYGQVAEQRGADAFRTRTWQQEVTALIRNRTEPQDTQGLVDLIAQVTPALQSVPLRLQELRYNRASGLMQFQAEAESTDELERLRSLMAQNQLTVSYSATRGGRGFVGDFRVRMADGSDV